MIAQLVDEGIAFGFSRPADLAPGNGGVGGRYGVALVLDVEADEPVRDAAQALSRELPCVLVSDTPMASREPFYAVVPTATVPARLYERARQMLADRPEVSGLVATAPAMQRVRGQIERVAYRPTPVLLQGETGAGKAVVAREIHRCSGRAGAFVVLDCAGVVDTEIDAELFGVHDPRRTEPSSGCLAAAQGGTLLLDGVDQASSLLQARLLWLFTSGRYCRTGESQSRRLDTRVIATTRGGLGAAVEAGRFRPDLYHSLNVFPIDVPPLRERVGDIVDLINALAADRSTTPPRFDAPAMARLEQHPWPGNVRELANCVERLAIASPSQMIDVGLLDACLDPVDKRPATPSSPDAQIASMTVPEHGVDLRALVERLEKRLIQQALDHNEQVVAHAARTLGLRRTTLTEKLRRYGISPG